MKLEITPRREINLNTKQIKPTPKQTQTKRKDNLRLAAKKDNKKMRRSRKIHEPIHCWCV